MFHDQQAEALSVAYIFISKMRFKARDQVNFCIKPFQTGLLTTINAICMLHEDLKTLYNEPLLLLLHLSQDELERFFGQIRGLGGGFCLHPKALQFLQRLGQSVILILLKDKLFNLLALKAQFNLEVGEFTPENQPRLTRKKINYSLIQTGGLDEISTDVITKFHDIEFNDELKQDLKKMYTIFNANHPKDGIKKEKNLLTGK